VVLSSGEEMPTAHGWHELHHALNAADPQWQSYLDATGAPEHPRTHCLSCPHHLALHRPHRCVTSQDVVYPLLPECILTRHTIPAAHNVLCSRGFYQCPGSGVTMALPLFSTDEMNLLYGSYYRNAGNKSQMTLKAFMSNTGLRHKYEGRGREQSAIIHHHAREAFGSARNLSIVEVGCMAGVALSFLGDLASDGGRLFCFEPQAHTWPTKEMLRYRAPGVQTSLYKSMLEPGVLGSSSVDVLTSSHVLEHMTDPTVWANEARRILKPGGIVFTELPYEHYKLEPNRTKVIDEYVEWINKVKATRYISTFHISLFGREKVGGEFPFNRMMQGLGFEVLSDPSMLSCHPNCSETKAHPGMGKWRSLNTYVHRKPLRTMPTTLPPKIATG